MGLCACVCVCVCVRAVWCHDCVTSISVILLPLSVSVSVHCMSVIIYACEQCACVYMRAVCVSNNVEAGTRPL